MRNRIIATMLAILVLSSCNDFDEINTNPDSTTVVSASMLCTSVVLSIAKYNGKDAKAFVAENALSKYVGYTNEGQMAEQYNLITNGSFSPMTILPNIEKMVEYGEDGVSANAYKGVGKFARAFMFYTLTMQMGDIPYSQAGGGANGFYKPAYDAQEDILIGVLDELKQADAYFAAGETFEGDPTPYNGNSDKWRRATNAFALKVLMTLSNKADNSSVDVKTRFREIVDSGHLLEESTGFWGLAYSAVNTHTLYSTSNIFTGRTILSELVVDNLKKLNDRRLYYFGEPSVAQIDAGLDKSDPDAYVGCDVSMDYVTMSTNQSAGMYSIINLRYQLDQDSEPRRLITYAEQQLILAEAFIRGWISSGSARDYYESGVRSALANAMQADANYAHGMAIDQDYIDNYFTGEAAFKTTEDEQLKQLWMQRYIMNFLIDGVTAYFEYRRTGYPEFPINPATNLNENNKSRLPLRWLYPSTEASYNSASLADAVNRQFDGYDEINKVMWVLK